MDNPTQVRHFKLANGEEIIGVLAVKNDDSYLIERPVSLIPNMLGHMQFQPWFPLSDTSTFKVYKVNVIQSAPVDEYVKEEYIKFVLDTKKTKYKIQSTQQALSDILKKERQYIEEQLEEAEMDFLPQVPEKKVLH